MCSAGGGTPQTLANVNTVGASWSEDGTIVFADPKGIQRVRAAGGMPKMLFASPSPTFYSWPQVLPGGRFVLYTEALPGMLQGVTVVRALTGADRKVVIQNSYGARYVQTGHLVYAASRGLMAVPFDLAARVTTGRAFPDGASCEAGGAVILSAEDDLEDTIRPRLDAARADPSRVVCLAGVQSLGPEGRLSFAL